MGYVALTLVFSILMFGYLGMSFADTGDLDVGSFGGSSAIAFREAAEQSFGISVSPATVLAFSSVMSILKEYGVIGDVLPCLDFGICDYWPVRLISFLWFAVSMLFSMLGSKAEEIESKYIGPIMCFILAFYRAANFMSGGELVSAAGFDSSVAVSVGTGVLTIILEFLKLTLSLLVFFIVRYTNYGVSLFVALLSGIHYWINALYKFGRAVLVIALLIIADKFPALFYVIYGVIILISFFVFRWAVSVIRYVKAIFIRPFFSAIFRRKKDVPLVHKKAPKKYRSASVCIPVFFMKNSDKNLKVKKRDLWWLVSSEGSTFFVSSRGVARKEQKFTAEGLYVRNPGLLNNGIEIFDMKDAFKKTSNGNRSLLLVMSREYAKKIPGILEITGFKEYVKPQKGVETEAEVTT
ncbi:MAG: hypothetical protein J5883_04135 [Clostridiales bacterium]|nr:hypothetical protein [Clostridiales bacterium]